MLCGDYLEYINQYKYVGLYISCHLNYKDGMEILSDAANRSLGMLISKYKFMKHMMFNTYNTLYTTAVVPIIDYASEIWGNGKYVKNEIVRNIAARAFLVVHGFAPVDGMQGDLGWISCKTRRKGNIIRY